MKPIPLQLVTVCLENGQHGVFVGLPLVKDTSANHDSQVDDIWFSNIQEVPDQLEIKDLIQIIQAQLCECLNPVQ